MSIHRLSAGAGYQYLLRHTASGDVGRLAGTPLTAYYTASGYPPGRWLGSGLASLGATTAVDQPGRRIEAPTRVDPPPASGAKRAAGGSPGAVASDMASEPGGLASGSVVTEEQMSRLYGSGEHPITADRLGARYLVHRGTEQRIADRVARLPGGLPDRERTSAVAGIEAEERRRRTPSAVAGFDLTFTMPKSASVLWALAPPGLQARIAQAHHDVVAAVIAVLERDALFTRTGHGGVAQIGTRGAVAACFDHWDTRAGDPGRCGHWSRSAGSGGRDTPGEAPAPAAQGGARAAHRPLRVPSWTADRGRRSVRGHAATRRGRVAAVAASAHGEGAHRCTVERSPRCASGPSRNWSPSRTIAAIRPGVPR
jgi:TrwC relaxase